MRRSADSSRQPASRLVATPPRWIGVVLGMALSCVGCESPGGGVSFTPGQADEEVWAIRCVTLRTPDRFKEANAYADALKKVPGLKPELVQVLTDEDGTAVFYGRFRREYGPAGATDRFTPNQLTDLETIRSLRFQGAEVWPFILASMDVLPTYRSSHPEWNLADADGYWALHVAVFYNTETLRSRRSVAEQYCALLRQQGEHAYYHHGVTHSSVCIGTYPVEAVTEVRHEDPLTGMVSTALRIVDPDMLAAQQRFPISLQNGHKVSEIIRDRSGEIKERIPTPSFPVVIPKAQRELDKAKGG